MAFIEVVAVVLCLAAWRCTTVHCHSSSAGASGLERTGTRLVAEKKATEMSRNIFLSCHYFVCVTVLLVYVSSASFSRIGPPSHLVSCRYISSGYGVPVENFWNCTSLSGDVSCIKTGDSRYTRFRSSRFHISAILFQYHEEHQYPIRGHGRSCRAGLLSCARSSTDSPHHFDSGDYKLRPVMVLHLENPRECYTFCKDNANWTAVQNRKVSFLLTSTGHKLLLEN
jgi:hypothetical protein